MIKKHLQNIDKIYEDYLRGVKSLRQKEIDTLVELMKKSEQEKLNQARKSLKK